MSLFHQIPTDEHQIDISGVLRKAQEDKMPMYHDKGTNLKIRLI